MTTIYEVAQGDEVQNLVGDWLEIRYVEALIDQVSPLHYRSWRIQTADENWLTMYEIRAYRLRSSAAEPGSS